MTNQASRNEEMTDVFSAEKENLSKLPKKEFKLSPQKQYAIATAVVLLGGSAFAFKTFAGDVDVPDTAKDITTTTTGNATGVAAADSTKVDKPVQPAGTIKPDETIDIAHNVNDKMSFDEAFASARHEVGTGGIFTWHGHSYSTFIKEEWQSMSLVQRNDFLGDIGYKHHSTNHADHVTISKTHPYDPTIPVVPPTPVPTPEPVDPIIVRNVTEQHIHIHNEPEPEPIPMEPIVKFITIDGKEAMAIDEDNDGLVDSLVVMDEDGNCYSIFNSRETEGSKELDTVAILDPFTLDVITAKPLEENYELAMDDLEDSNLLFVETGKVVADNADTTVKEEDDVKTEEESEEETEEVSENNDDENYDNEADVTEMT